MGKVVTIDGPAASGKTSVSRELARRLGWSWVSTGAFYRGLGYVANHLGYNLEDEKKLAELALSNRWHVAMGMENTQVFLGEEDVTEHVFQESMGSVASKVSHFPSVRTALLEPQRACMAKTEGLVAEGRDCGTVVFPAAEVKIYLTARQENRAERRAKDMGLSVQETVEAQAKRDEQDASRKTAPMKIPDNAFVVDTTELNFNQVVELVEKYVKSQLKI